MNFPLKNIELHVDEHLFIIAEKQIDEDKVKNLQEADRHLWLATVDAYEVEIQITPSKVSACTCECDNYLMDEMCEHIIATLLVLRKQLSEQKKTPKKRKKVKHIPKKLTTAVILDQVPHDELVAFIQRYAKSNRNFSIALKTRFAAAVTLNDSKEKYLQLLEAALNVSRRRNRMITTRGYKRVVDVVEELIAQAEDTFAQDFYADTLVILQSIIEKITPVLNKTEGDNQTLLNLVLKAFDMIKELLKQPIPPALKTDIWHYALEESNRIAYWVNDFSKFIYDWLISLAKEKKRVDALLKHLDCQLTASEKLVPYRLSLLLIKLQVLEKAKRKRAIQKLVKENLNQADILIFSIEQALDKANYKRAKYLAIEGKKVFNERAILQQLDEAFLQVAQAEKDQEAIIDFAKKRLLSTLKFDYFSLLKNTVTDNWPLFCNSLLEELHALPYSLLKRDIIAAIYADEKMYDALLAYIQTLRSLDLLQRYDYLLFKHQRKLLYQLYTDFINAYLKNHLGRKAALKIRGMIQHLFKVGARDLADNLVTMIRRTYPERHALMDELVVF